MLGTGLRARLVSTSPSNLNIWSIPLNQRFAFLRLSNSAKSRQQQRGSISLLGLRSYSGASPLRSGRGSGNESSPFSSRRRNPPSKTLVEQEMDVDKWFDKRDGSMPKRRREDNRGSNGASVSSRGRGKPSGARPGGGDLKKAFSRAVETSDDDEDDTDLFEKREVSRSALRKGKNQQKPGMKNTNVLPTGARSQGFSRKESAVLELSEDEDDDDDDDVEFASKFSVSEVSAPKPKDMPTNAESNGESYLGQTR